MVQLSDLIAALSLSPNGGGRGEQMQMQMQTSASVTPSGAGVVSVGSSGTSGTAGTSGTSVPPVTTTMQNPAINFYLAPQTTLNFATGGTYKIGLRHQLPEWNAGATAERSSLLPAASRTAQPLPVPPVGPASAGSPLDHYGLLSEPRRPKRRICGFCTEMFEECESYRQHLRNSHRFLDSEEVNGIATNTFN